MTQEALKRVAEKLRRTGASIPAPEVTGTIEGSVVTGLCIALALVETEIEALAQPEQEPVPTLEDLEQEIYQNTRNFISRDVMEWMLRRYYTHLPQRTEQNFCPRCGKRTKDIHTCTPPKENT
jgi:rRNA maturation endonuclease Nob1